MKKKKIGSFERAVEYLLEVPRFTSKNTPEDTKFFLEKLGKPDRKLKIIHVAGTNGKGSVCAYLRSILETAGYAVAVFTSPHLVDIRERFLIKGKIISEEKFLWAFLQVYNNLDWEVLECEKEGCSVGYHPTFFEYLFFMAMLVFAEGELDYCILETGLGGRLDATNVVWKKEISIITRIGFDHVEYLGDTLEKIAEEKAGIMQEGIPVVFADVEESVSRVFWERAKMLNNQVFSVSKRDYSFLKINNKNIDFSLYTRYYGCIDVSLPTIALYQMENAALAVKAIEVLDKGRNISVQDLVRGLKNCVWKGRMEEVLPEVYVDGAHNEDGIRAFLETVKADGYNGARSLLFSVVLDKDYKHMVQKIVESGLFVKIAVVHMQTGRALSLECLDKLFSQYSNCKYSLYTEVSSAFYSLLSEQKAGERIYAAGSLYLVGEVKELIR